MTLENTFGGTYNPRKIAIAYGAVVISDWGDGDSVTIEYNGDRWDLLVGNTGSMVRSKLNDDSAMITIRVMPNSVKVLAALDALAKVDDATGNLAQPIVIVDTITGETYESAQAWIKSNPNKTYGQTAQPMEMVIQAASLGHTPPIIPPTPLG